MKISEKIKKFLKNEISGNLQRVSSILKDFPQKWKLRFIKTIKIDVVIFSQKVWSENRCLIRKIELQTTFLPNRQKTKFRQVQFT